MTAKRIPVVPLAQPNFADPELYFTEEFLRELMVWGVPRWNRDYRTPDIVKYSGPEGEFVWRLTDESTAHLGTTKLCRKGRWPDR